MFSHQTITEGVLTMKDKAVRSGIPPSTLSGDDVRTLMRQMAKMMDAIADGRVTVDGQRADAPPPAQKPYRPTIRELRASQDVQTRLVGDTPATTRRARRKLPPRRVYVLTVPDDKQIDMEGLSSAGAAILKYLAFHKQAAIGVLMGELGLRRSTIANVLTALRKQGLVGSKAVDSLGGTRV